MGKYTYLKRICYFLFFLTLLIGCNGPPGGGNAVVPPPGSAPAGDYGDAPEGDLTDYPDLFAQTGGFPTLFSSNGARTLRVDEATLGPTASVEVDANDPADPDGVQNIPNTDSDDGLTDLFISLTAIPPPTTLSVNVSAPEGSPGGSFWLNAVIDLNMDGQWGGRGANGEMEWVVQNRHVDVVPGATIPFTSPPFAFSNGNLLPDGAYMRIALTREKVPANWDGTGEFSSGEIEDHFIRLPVFDGNRKPMLTVDCNGPYRPGQRVNCVVTNFGGAGTFTYLLRHTGNGTVNVPIATCISPGGEPPGGPVNIGSGPPPVAGPPPNPVTITCNSTPGGAPDTWRFIARVQDPGSNVVKGGIEVGYSGESSADAQFEGEPKVMNVYLAGFIGSYQHFSGSSVVISDLTVVGDDPVPMEGANVTLRMTHPDGSSETQTTTTGSDGTGSVEFTIYVYGKYVVEVENIQGDYMVYDPALNAASSLEIDVGPGESTPVGTVDTEDTEDIEDIEDTEDTEAFVNVYNTAFEAGDVNALLESLHPEVIDLYGTEACRAYLESVIETPIHLEILEVSEVASWQWEIDGHSTHIENAYTVEVNFTVQGQTTQMEVHFARGEDGSMSWFTDCGDPLP